MEADVDMTCKMKACQGNVDISLRHKKKGCEEKDALLMKGRDYDKWHVERTTSNTP